MCVHMTVHFSSRERETWRIAADRSNYFHDFTLSSWICLRESSSLLEPCNLLLKSDRCASNDAFYKRGLAVCRPASPKALTLPQGSDRDDFNSSQPLNDGWTCSCRNIWQAAVSCDNRDWVNEGRKVGRSRRTLVPTDHGWWQMEWRGDCKKDRRSICGIDNMVSAPRWGDVTGWQVGCCCLCHWLGDQGRHAETPATQTPGSEAYDFSRGRGDTWTHSGTHTLAHAHTLRV